MAGRPVSRILVFGATGQGKSSLINLLKNSWTAPVSDSAVGETFKTTYYPFPTDEYDYTFVDTVGLGEAGDCAKVKGDVALKNLLQLLRDTSAKGFNLAIMVHKDTKLVTAAFNNNYKLFVDVICKDCGVPVILVKLGLEKVTGDPSHVWLIEQGNGAIIDKQYPDFKDTVCGSAALAEHHHALDQFYKIARDQTCLDVWKAIDKYQAPEPGQRTIGFSFKRTYNSIWSLIGKLDFSAGQGWNNLVLKMTSLNEAGHKAYDLLVEMGYPTWEAKQIAVELTR